MVETSTVIIDGSFKGKPATFRKTAYIRFDLAERLGVINYLNLVVSIMLTVYLSGWGIFIAFFPGSLNNDEANIISYVSVMATIALMCLTILDYTADRAVKARAFLQCANKILKVADDLDYRLIVDSKPEEVKLIIDSYNSILADSEWNHSSEDHALFERKAESKKSLFHLVKYTACLYKYYIKRTFLQIALSAMVMWSTYLVISSMLHRS